MSLPTRYSWLSLTGLAFLGLISVQQLAEAAAPPAPSNIKVYTTRDESQAQKVAWWHVTWQDNALDEAGYIVRGRYLHRGRPLTPYYIMTREAPNSTSTIFSLIEQIPDISMQFQVVAFKNNGSKMETSTTTSPQRVNYLAGNAFNKPENFTITKVEDSDGLYDLKWDDKSSTEIYHLLSYREATSPTWREAQISLFGDTDIRRAISLKPEANYQFRVRAQRFSSPAFTDYSEIKQITTEPLAPPTNLGVTVLNDTTIRLDWNDNSDNTMGYEIQYFNEDTNSFEIIDYAGGNDTSYTVSVPRGSAVEWRVRGAFQDSELNLHYSTFSNIASAQTFFSAPSNVVVAATGLAGSVAVQWSYDTGEATQYQILGRYLSEQGIPQGQFATLMTLPATTNEALVSGLNIGQQIEIGVRALGTNSAVSAITEAVPVTPQHGFDPAWYVANLDPANFGTVLLTPLREIQSSTPGGDPGGPDTDGDGIPDAHDSHPNNPNLWCDWNNNGVNDNDDEPDMDGDGDGVPDEFDSHPNNPALWCDWDLNGINDHEEARGIDSDGDGVADDDDSHPNNPNVWCDWNDNGINDNDEPLIEGDDLDGDGVPDDFDSHPNDSLLWCDWNDNGVNDNEETRGTDSDGDGVADDNDSHPENDTLWCDWNNNGINDNEESTGIDSDGDGVADAHDSHPFDASLWTDWNDNGINNHEEDFGLSTSFIAAHDVVAGTAFASQLAITNEEDASSRTMTGLPEDVDFNEGTGNITGIPKVPGIVQSTATVVYNNGTTATAKLVFRVQQPPAPPQATETLLDRTIGTGLSLNLTLDSFFTDPDAPRVARLATTKGDIDIALNEDLTPQAVANFLAYVTGGDYDGVAFHRSVSGFVVQGGGYKPASAPNIFTSVNQRPAPRNEPGISNVRGTVAAAKLGFDPNSATHDFFFNLEDNNQIPDPNVNLDTQNQGFTVFGRVVAGMDVVDEIAALPTANYTIQLDGFSASFQGWPMDDTSAPSTMDISKTVKITTATEVSPLVFSVQDNSDPGVLTAEISGTQLSLTGLTSGSAEITVRATDYDGNHVDQTFTVEVADGHLHPAITEHPEDQTVAPGSQAVFSVNAEGTALGFVWRKNGVPLPLQPGGPELVLNNVTEDDEGEYDVVVTNATTSVTSSAAQLQVTQSAGIVTNLTPRIVTSGQPLVLALELQGKPAPQVSWFKNNQPLAATGPTLAINSATMADHGLYRAEITNPSGSAQSLTVAVVVVDGSARRSVVKQGSNTSLTVNVASPPGITLNYQWKNGQGGNVAQGGRFDGVNKPKLNLKGINHIEGPDIYTCVVSGPGAMGSTTSGPFDVIVSETPEVTAITDLPLAVVGQAYEHLVQVRSEKSQTPTSFAITGLPRGLKYDKATGRIHGIPLVGGKYRVRITAANPHGRSPQVTADLFVVPMPTNTTGQFVGLIERHAEVNALCGGRLDLDVSDNTAFSAKLTLASGVHRLRGTVTRTVQGINSQSVTVITGSGVLKRRNLPDLTLNFVINANNGNLSGDLRLDETKKATLTGWKHFWHRIYQPASESGLAGAFHFGMTIPEDSVGDLNVPQGKGHGRLTVNDSGIATITGRTIDNKPVLLSAPLGPAGSFIVFQRLYKNRGSLLGPLGISLQDANLFGFVTHAEIRNVTGFSLDQYKPVQPAGTRDYKDGFNPPVSLTAFGGNYNKPSPNTGTLNAIARLGSNGSLDGDFGAPVQANQAILAMCRQNDQILIGGLFGSYDRKPVAGIARLNAIGTLDESFNAGGSGANGAVYGITLDADGKILIVGSFTQFNGETRIGIARLNADGTLDDTFDPGDGPDDVVECVAVQADGAIVISGRFSAIGTTARSGIARLTNSGELDTTFNPGSGVNNIVRCLAIQSDQKILIGGDFTSYNGTGRVRIARLNANGSLDTGFNPSAGANSSVLAIAVHTDGRIMIGGAFTQYNTQSRNRVARLTSAGALVGTGDFNPGTGTSGEVRSLVIRADGRILIGGYFLRYNSTSENSNGVALLQANGALDTAFTPVVSADNRNNVRALISLPSNQVLIGGWVWSRVRSDRVLGLNDSKDKALVDFSQARINLFPASNPDATFTISDKNRATPFGSNPAGTTWSYNAGTGVIKGRSILRNGSVSRAVNYTTLLIPVSPSDYRALGVFDLAEPPDGISITNRNSPIHTGSVEIAPAP